MRTKVILDSARGKRAVVTSVNELEGVKEVMINKTQGVMLESEKTMMFTLGCENIISTSFRLALIPEPNRNQDFKL